MTSDEAIDIIKDGDLVSIDLVILKNGFISI